MSIIYSEEQLQELAQSVFKDNPKKESLLATGDGQFFFKESKIAAHNHASNNGGLKIYTIDNPNAPKVEVKKDTKTDKK